MANNKKKNKIDASPTIADQSTKKKISFFSAMFIVVGSCIGAGIFFKSEGVLKDSHGSLIFAIFCWVIAAAAVIIMALALVEIASARNDNLSIIGWCKVFNSRKIYKASKNFMFYIYLPLTYFFMPIYVIMSLQDGIGCFGINNFGTQGYDWIIWMIFALVIDAFFIFVSGMSSKAGNVMNWGILAVKFIPLVVASVIGFVFIGLEGTSQIHIGFDNDAFKISPTTSFSALSPGIGLFMAIGGVFFAYDGFYYSAGIQSEMKEPKKTPMAILLGLGTTTVVYLLIAISMALNGTGSFYGFGQWLTSNGWGWLFGLVNICIAIGILGILNSFAMWAPRFIEDLVADNELPLSNKYKHKLNPNKPMVGIWYSIAISLPFVIVATLIGALAYSNTGGYDASNYGEKQMTTLFSFADLVGTWTAVFAFSFVMLAIYGGLKNRRHKFVETNQQKWFVWSGSITVVIISIVLIFLILEPIVDLFLLIQIADPNVTFNDVNYDSWNEQLSVLNKELVSNPNNTDLINQIKGLETKINNNFTVDDVVGRVMTLVMLIAYLVIMFVPTYVEDKIHIRKYGSIEKYNFLYNIETTQMAREKASLNVLNNK